MQSRTIMLFVIYVACSPLIVVSQAVVSSNDTPKVIIAVVDTGVDVDNQALHPFYLKNTAEVPNNGKDDDNNEYIDDYIGFDAVAGQGSAKDTNGHGTMVATVALGKSSNGITIPDSAMQSIKLLPVRVLPGGNVLGANYAFTEGMHYALDMAEHYKVPMVINVSWIWTVPKLDPQLRQAFKRARKLGVLVVASAGNEYGQYPYYPAALKLNNIIAVCATTGAYLAPYSNIMGDIGAEGTNITTIGLDNRSIKESGTSLSAPAVSTVAATILYYQRKWSYKKVKAQILSSADTLSTLPKIKNHRKLNAAKTLAFAAKSPME